jgi:hypothetical protein
MITEGLVKSTDDLFAALYEKSDGAAYTKIVHFHDQVSSMVTLTVLAASFVATMKALWVGGSPFAGFTALWATNEDGKYVIEAEGIRLAFTNRNGGAPTNLWITDKNGNEVDILLGLDKADEYDEYVGQLGGTIGIQNLSPGISLSLTL